MDLTRIDDQALQRAALLNDLGNVLMALDRTDQALGAYADAAVVAQNLGESVLKLVEN